MKYYFFHRALKKRGDKGMEKKRPNILFLFTDQQRPDSLGCYGNEVAMTPNLDKLADEGVLFENCYGQNPLCVPSRHSILTGRYPHSHRARLNWYKRGEEEKSFAHRLGRVGYNTATCGKMHLTPWYENFGFDGRIIAEAKFHKTCPDDYQKFLKKYGWDRRDVYDDQSDQYIKQCTAVKSKLPQELHIDAFIGRSICEYLKNTKEPFCCFASFVSPHNPYDPPKPYDELFINKKLPERNMYKGETREKPREIYDYINNIIKWSTKTDELNSEQLHLIKAYYYSLVTFIDDWVGRIVEVLKEERLYENTVIIYASDHGDLLGDHGLFFKQSFYEQSVKIPLIIHAPTMFGPRRIDNLVELMDIYNTICELGKAWPGEGIQGKSLLPLLKGEKNYLHREAIFSENWFGRMVCYKNYKLIYYPGKTYGELYDLRKDPLEHYNLWNKLEGSRIKNHLKDLLLDWAFTSEDPLPLPARLGHQDFTPPHMQLVNGRSVISDRQPWYLDDLITLYEQWDFKESGKLR